jgi:hypothetical protein
VWKSGLRTSNAQFLLCAGCAIDVDFDSQINQSAWLLLMYGVEVGLYQSPGTGSSMRTTRRGTAKHCQHTTLGYQSASAAQREDGAWTNGARGKRGGLVSQRQTEALRTIDRGQGSRFSSTRLAPVSPEKPVRTREW